MENNRKKLEGLQALVITLYEKVKKLEEENKNGK